ncbi:LOW QUALITY PROTEIN: hypothetical protein HID58_069723 [Brassica napus]|uniref:F-box protein At3g26010-like beta-propeller domain-containing protein n=1 Tax=Brassica napus TaxID=3708 RepID=A0ABQ7YWV1_BRANA|nr:LOW QUALITY PROTEIN: hypothetical protein HID58_069723 [Brassica napus]
MVHGDGLSSNFALLVLFRDLTIYLLGTSWSVRPVDTSNDTSRGVLVAYDFYAKKTDNQCRIIPLPGPYNKYVKRCLTTSCGDVIYVEMLYQRLKVWKLKINNNSDGEWWQLAREEIDMAFDSTTPLRGVGQEFTLHRETETWSDGEVSWRISTYYSEKYMEETHEHETDSVITLSQYVLPQWMDPVPRPPY